MPEHFGHDEPDLQGLMRKAFIDAIEISVGSLSPTVNWRDLNGQEFDLPPLDEQKRIANLI